jgi:uncharacterized membrane protein (Fun14 family)
MYIHSPPVNRDTITSVSATIGGGFFGGMLLGYALKKVLKLIAVVFGLFLAGLAYLQYQQIAFFNWDKIEGAISTIANTTTGTFNNYNAESLSPNVYSSAGSYSPALYSFSTIFYGMFLISLKY